MARDKEYGPGARAMANKKEEPVPCRNCGGSGTVMDKDENGKPLARTCGVCKGSGVV